MMEKRKLIIIGASGHGKVIADIASCLGYKDISFLDDNPNVRQCLDFPVIGTSKDVMIYPKAEFVVAVGNASVRERIQNELRDKGLRIAVLIHPRAVVAAKVRLGEGTVVMAGAVINPDTEIGRGCIINTGATVDHDNRIGSFAHVSVGSHLAGTVSIGDRTWVGAGAVISNNITVCKDCMIGAGAVVIEDIGESGTYMGVPAKRKRYE